MHGPYVPFRLGDTGPITRDTRVKKPSIFGTDVRTSAAFTIDVGVARGVNFTHHAGGGAPQKRSLIKNMVHLNRSMRLPVVLYVH